MSILGIDLDSHAVHVVILNEDDDQAFYMRFRVSHADLDYHARARRLRDVMPERGHWRDIGVTRIGIEEQMTAHGHGGFQSAVPQAVMRGALLACLPRDIPLEMLPAHAWKKASLGGGEPGKGNAQKPEIRTWAREHWANIPGRITQDACDAFCVAWAARTSIDLPKGVAV